MTKDYYVWAHFLKHAEGGITQRWVKTVAERCGVDVKFGGSCYIGNFTVLVRTEDKRKLDRLGRELGVC
jgi:hypothetical protein